MLRSACRQRRLPCLRPRTACRSASSAATSSPAGSAPPSYDPRDVVRRGDFENYLAGSFLPSHARDSFFAMRAFNTEVAGVRDAARGNPVTGHMRMAFWRDFVDKVFKAAARQQAGGAAVAAAGAGQPGTHPLFPYMLRAVTTHKHTRRWLERLVEARDRDLDGAPPGAVSDLEAYAEATASSLLYLSLEAAGVRDVQADHAASHIGKALGLATVIRGLPVHCRLGQRYVPDELLQKHGLTASDLTISPEEVTTADGKPLIPGWTPGWAPAAAAHSAGGSGSGTGTKAGDFVAATGAAKGDLGAPAVSAGGCHGHSHAPGEVCSHPSHGGQEAAAPSSRAAPAAGASRARSSGRNSGGLNSSFFELDEPKPAAAASLSAGASAGAAAHAVPTSGALHDAATGPGGIRLTASPAARRLAQRPPTPAAAATGAGASGTAGTEAAAVGTAGAESASPAAGAGAGAVQRPLHLPPGVTGRDVEAAAAALRSGIGAPGLVLHKPPAVASALRGVVFDLACQARAHLEHAREMQHSVPAEARAALLPAVPLGRFLARLEAQDFDVFAAGGLGPWVDGRPFARLLMQLDFIRHTVRNSY